MRRKPYVIIFVLLIIFYLGLLLFLPVDPATLQKYHLTASRARLLSLTVGLPMCVIWFSALYGFAKFKSYAKLIYQDQDGKAFNYLANGLMVLGFSLPVNSILSSVFTYITIDHPNFMPASEITRNYVGLLFQIVSFAILSKGALELLNTLRPKVTTHFNQFVIFAGIAASSAFTWLLSDRPLGGDSHVIYFMASGLVMLTIVIPYLFTWYLGIITVYRLKLYTKKTKGLVYQKTLHSLVRGMSVIIGLSIVIRILITLSERLNRLNFTPLLIVIYVLLAVYIVGFGLVAKGARALKKIEEV